MTFSGPIAHGSIEGIGDLWNGLIHPLRSASHLLLLLSLGLFAGQRRRYKKAVAVFVGCAAAGLIYTRVPGATEPLPALLCGLSALSGILVTLRRPFPQTAGLLLFGASGFVLGWDSGPDETSGWVSFKILLGVWAGLTVLLLNLASYGAMIPKKTWVKIAFRVLGSWIVAISALSLALSLKR